MAREELARLLSRLLKRGQSARCCDNLAQLECRLLLVCYMEKTPLFGLGFCFSEATRRLTGSSKKRRTRQKKQSERETFFFEILPVSCPLVRIEGNSRWILRWRIVMENDSTSAPDRNCCQHSRLCHR